MEAKHPRIVESGSEEPKMVFCDPCKYEQKTAKADTFCVQCNENLCPQCKHFHTKFQVTRNHTLKHGYITQKKETKPLHLKLCDIHRTNEVKYYCNNHKSVICTICKASIHSSCKLQLISEVMQYSTDKHQLNITKDSIQDLIKSFKRSIQGSSKKLNDVKQIALQYRTKILSIKEKFVQMLDQTIDDITTAEKESLDKYLKESEAEEVYHDAISDLESLSRNIQEVKESNDAVATFSGNFKALKLREEYSQIERKMTTGSSDLSANFQKYKQLIDQIENCLMLCELYIKPSQQNACQPNIELTRSSQEEGVLTLEGTNKIQLKACLGTLASATRYSDSGTRSNTAQIHSKTSQDVTVQHATLQELSSLAAIPDYHDNNLEERKISNMKKAYSRETTAVQSNTLCEVMHKPSNMNKEEFIISSTESIHSTTEESIASESSGSNQIARDKHTDIKSDNHILYSKVVQTSRQQPVHMTFNNMKLSTRKHCVIRSQNDKNTCDITGSTFLPDGGLAVCDHENMNIKLTNTDFEVTYSFQLSTKPWDITVTAENELAVTLPLSKTVRFILITNETLKNCKKFQVKQDVWGIHSYGDLIIISLHDINNSNGSVEIRKHNGVLVKQIKSDMFGNQFFKSPGYVFVDKLSGNIYVSDGKKNAIFCFTQDGLMVRHFEDGGLRWPRKIINDNDNNLIICSRFSDSLKLLPPQNDLYRTLFSNCVGPQTVSYRETDKLLIVGGNFSDTLLILQYNGS